jgi:pyruvate/2-oxoacid:ferredoxin oxidoreductase beta subunit
LFLSFSGCFAADEIRKRCCLSVYSGILNVIKWDNAVLFSHWHNRIVTTNNRTIAALVGFTIIHKAKGTYIAQIGIAVFLNLDWVQPPIIIKNKIYLVIILLSVKV